VWYANDVMTPETQISDDEVVPSESRSPPDCCISDLLPLERILSSDRRILGFFGFFTLRILTSSMLNSVCSVIAVSFDFPQSELSDSSLLESADSTTSSLLILPAL
jgi:hypothetical protein